MLLAHKKSFEFPFVAVRIFLWLPAHIQKEWYHP
jgi:hypothetical protein